MAVVVLRELCQAWHLIRNQGRLVLVGFLLGFSGFGRTVVTAPLLEPAAETLLLSLLVLLLLRTVSIGEIEPLACIACQALLAWP